MSSVPIPDRALGAVDVDRGLSREEVLRLRERYGRNAIEGLGP